MRHLTYTLIFCTFGVFAQDASTPKPLKTKVADLAHRFVDSLTGSKVHKNWIEGGYPYCNYLDNNGTFPAKYNKQNLGLRGVFAWSATRIFFDQWILSYAHWRHASRPDPAMTTKGDIFLRHFEISSISLGYQKEIELSSSLCLGLSTSVVASKRKGGERVFIGIYESTGNAFVSGYSYNSYGYGFSAKPYLLIKNRVSLALDISWHQFHDTRELPRSRFYTSHEPINQFVSFQPKIGIRF